MIDDVFPMFFSHWYSYYCYIPLVLLIKDIYYCCIPLVFPYYCCISLLLLIKDILWYIIADWWSYNNLFLTSYNNHSFIIANGNDHICFMICSPSRSALSSYGEFAGLAEVSSFNSVDKRTAPVPDEQLQEASVRVVKPWGPWVPNYN